ncbi:MAG: CopG family transcriptional regulator [Clostridia bacterium]|nr:CopG family transcriptional regulator [Clostridia bacterium]
MERTQVYFEKSEKEKLIKAAQKKGKPMAELIREAVSEYLVKEQDQAQSEDDPIKRARGFMKGSKFTVEEYLKQKQQEKELEK